MNDKFGRELPAIPTRQQQQDIPLSVSLYLITSKWIVGNVKSLDGKSCGFVYHKTPAGKYPRIKLRLVYDGPDGVRRTRFLPEHERTGIFAAIRACCDSRLVPSRDPAAVDVA